jgi:hypothetical protein
MDKNLNNDGWASATLAGQHLAGAAVAGLGNDLRALDELLQAVKLATLTSEGRAQFCDQCVVTLHFAGKMARGE